MKLIIDIPEDGFLACKHWVKGDVAQWAEAIIANGTPLPKVHGDLIDKNEYFQGSFNDAREFLDKATTIIAADKQVKEND